MIEFKAFLSKVMSTSGLSVVPDIDVRREILGAADQVEAILEEDAAVKRMIIEEFDHDQVGAVLWKRCL